MYAGFALRSVTDTTHASDVFESSTYHGEGQTKILLHHSQPKLAR
jgi:hypothetical protein